MVPGPPKRFAQVLGLSLRELANAPEWRPPTVVEDREDDAGAAGYAIGAVEGISKGCIGTDLEKLHGEVTSKGTYDGRRVRAQGAIDIDSVTALGYHRASNGALRLEPARASREKRGIFHAARTALPGRRSAEL